MSTSEERIEELTAIPRRTFGAIPRPRCTKRIARARDDEWVFSPKRANELSALDTEQKWWDLSDGELLEFSDILYWISPEGFRFYYPAFLSYTLRHWSGMHDRVHLEIFETIGQMSENLELLTLEELQFMVETIVELSCDPKGACYECGPSLLAIEAQIRCKA